MGRHLVLEKNPTITVSTLAIPVRSQPPASEQMRWENLSPAKTEGPLCAYLKGQPSAGAWLAFASSVVPLLEITSPHTIPARPYSRKWLCKVKTQTRPGQHRSSQRLGCAEGWKEQVSDDRLL